MKKSTKNLKTLESKRVNDLNLILGGNDGGGGGGGPVIKKKKLVKQNH